MELDLPTFLVTVYSLVDDLYQVHLAPHKPVRRGAVPHLSDSAVLTLSVLAPWQQDRSERAFLRTATRQWRSYFPRLLSQRAFNRRARDLAGALCLLGPLVGRQLGLVLFGPAAYEVLDGVPVPRMRRCRGNRHRLFANEAAVGRGGSDRDFYYGVKLFLALHAHGLITGFVFGPANTEERWLADALLRWRREPEAPAPTAAALAPVLDTLPYHQRPRHGPTGPLLPALAAGLPAPGPYLADCGLRGTSWVAHWRRDYGAAVLTKAAYAPRPHLADQVAARRWLCALRQRIENINQLLSDCFGLKFPRARSLGGLRARVGAKLAACNLALVVNGLFHRPPFRVFPLFE